MCFVVVEKAIELGLEILLRVPNLSYVLQGEDTVNFKVITTLLCYYADVANDADAAATTVVAIADDVADASVADVATVVVVVVAVVVAAATAASTDVDAATNAAANAYDTCDA